MRRIVSETKYRRIEGVFETEGILKELRKREAHQTKSQKNKLKSIAARQLANKKNRKKEGKFNAK